jgi:hypothetical protein
VACWCDGNHCRVVAAVRSRSDLRVHSELSCGHHWTCIPCQWLSVAPPTDCVCLYALSHACVGTPINPRRHRRQQHGAGSISNNSSRSRCISRAHQISRRQMWMSLNPSSTQLDASVARVVWCNQQQCCCGAKAARTHSACGTASMWWSTGGVADTRTS